MFDRYTEPARRALFFARYEASQFGSMTIETEHLLLGLVRERIGVLARLLAEVPIAVVRAEVERRRPKRAPSSPDVEIPFSGETKRALQRAAEEADRLGHGEIGCEHLLLGVLRDEASVASSILNDHGVNLEPTRKRIADLRHLEPALAEAGPILARIEEVRRLVEHLSTQPAGSAEASLALGRIRSVLDQLQATFSPASRPPS